MQFCFSASKAFVGTKTHLSGDIPWYPLHIIDEPMSFSIRNCTFIRWKLFEWVNVCLWKTERKTVQKPRYGIDEYLPKTATLEEILYRKDRYFPLKFHYFYTIFIIQQVFYKQTLLEKIKKSQRPSNENRCLLYLCCTIRLNRKTPERGLCRVEFLFCQITRSHPYLLSLHNRVFLSFRY